MKAETTYRPMPQDSLEDVSLLKSGPEDECSISEACKHSSVCGQRTRRLLVLVVLEGLALAVLFGAGLAFYVIKNGDQSASSTSSHFLYSPAQSAVTYETRVFHEGFGSDQSIYQQNPSPEVDHAWDEMYNFGMSRITKEEATNLVNHTYRLPGDEDHYVVQLDVFHQIHCLNMLRKALYPEYYKNMPGDHMDKSHWGHCIESIRQSLLCSADISPLVWQWIDRVEEVRIVGKIAHTCRSFEKIREWSLERQLHYELNFTGFH